MYANETFSIVHFASNLRKNLANDALKEKVTFWLAARRLIKLFESDT